MTKEQREAIETMQHWIEFEKKHKDEINKADELIHIQDTVLSLIKEQQKEIEEREKALYVEILENYDREELLKVKLKKKDKQIDLMAEKIVMTKPINCTKTNEFSTRRVCMSKEEIKQYFERKVEDVES